MVLVQIAGSFVLRAHLPSPFLCSTNASDLSPSECVHLSPQLMETIRSVYFHLPLQLPKSCLAALSWAAVWPFSEDAFLEASEPSTACYSVSESYCVCCFLSVHLVADQFGRSNSVLRKMRSEVNVQTPLTSSRLPSWISRPIKSCAELTLPWPLTRMLRRSNFSGKNLVIKFISRNAQ